MKHLGSRRGFRIQRGSRASRSGRASNCTPIWLPSATIVPQLRGGRLRLGGRWQQEQKTCGRGVFMPLLLAGEAFQFDWSEDWAIIAGERIKLEVAHFKLYSCALHSRSSAADP